MLLTLMSEKIIFQLKIGTESRCSLLRISETHQWMQQLSKYCSRYAVTIIALRSNIKHSRSFVHSANTLTLRIV